MPRYVHCPTCSMTASERDRRLLTPVLDTARRDLRRCRNCGALVDVGAQLGQRLDAPVG